jgi:hypothetical protein
LEVGPKWLQLLHEMVPNAKSLALLINPTSPNLAEAQSKDLQAAARNRGLQLHVLKARGISPLVCPNCCHVKRDRRSGTASAGMVGSAKVASY